MCFTSCSLISPRPRFEPQCIYIWHVARVWHLHEREFISVRFSNRVCLCVMPHLTIRRRLLWANAQQLPCPDCWAAQCEASAEWWVSSRAVLSGGNFDPECWTWRKLSGTLSSILSGSVLLQLDIPSIKQLFVCKPENFLLLVKNCLYLKIMICDFKRHISIPLCSIITSLPPSLLFLAQL